MSATVTSTVSYAIGHMSDQALTQSVGLIGIILLTVLLTQQELFRSVGGSRTRRSLRVLNVAIVPLLLMFTAIILVRLVDIFYFHGVR